MPSLDIVDFLLSIPSIALLLGLATILSCLVPVIYLYIHLNPIKKQKFAKYFKLFCIKKFHKINQSYCMMIILGNESEIIALPEADHVLINKQLKKLSSKVFYHIDKSGGLIHILNGDKVLICWPKLTSAQLDTTMNDIYYEINQVNKLFKKHKFPMLDFRFVFSNQVNKTEEEIEDYMYSLYHFSNPYKIRFVSDNKFCKETIELLTMPNITKIYTNVFGVNEIKITFSQHQKFIDAFNSNRYEMALIIASSLRSAWNLKLSNYYDIIMLQCKKAIMAEHGKEI